MLKNPVSQGRLDKLKEEFSDPALAQVVPRHFQSSSFEKELMGRTTRLLRQINFPALILQGDVDVWQPSYYHCDPRQPAVSRLPNAQLVWIEDAGH